MRARLAQWKSRIKERLGLLWWYTAVMFGVQRLGDLINIYIGLWLVPRWVPESDLGALLPLGQVGALLGLPLAVLLVPFQKFLSVFATRGENGKVKALVLDVFALVGAFALVVTAYTYLAGPFVLERLRVGGRGLVWLLSGIALIGALAPVLSNALQSLQRFRVMAVNGFVGAPLKLAALLALLPAFGLAGFLGAQLLVAVAGVAIAIWGLHDVLSHRTPRSSYRSHLGEMIRYMVPVLVLTGVGTLQSTCELFVLRHRVSNDESAAFYIISRFAEIPGSLWGAFNIVLFPLISERHERGHDTQRILRHSMLVCLLVGGLAAAALAWTARPLLGLRPAWRVYTPCAWLMGVVAVRTVLVMALACFTTHEIACRRFRFVAGVTALQLVEIALLYGLTGIGFFQPYLPPAWWQWVSRFNFCRLDFISGIMLAYAALGLLLVALPAMMRPPAAPGTPGETRDAL